MKTFFVFACIIVAGYSQNTVYKPCEHGPVPLMLKIEGCDSSPCHIYKGSNLSAWWDFTAKADAKSLEPRVNITLFDVTVPYPFPEKNACNSLTNGKCPLKKDEKARYNLKMPIDNTYPEMSLGIEFGLVDENMNMHVCFNVDCKVTKK